MSLGPIARCVAASVACVGFLVACGPDGVDDTAGTSSGSTSDVGGSTTSTTASSTSVGTATSMSTSSATGSSGGGEPCDGQTCMSGQYCNWAKDSCGDVNQDIPDQGMCTDLPSDCAEILDPVCGCDGQIHDNQCIAGSMGIDVSAAGGCEPPPGQFPCGYRFCPSGETYCFFQFNDISISPDMYTCEPIPDGCGDTPDCECVVDVPCVSFGCTLLPSGDLLISC